MEKQLPLFPAVEEEEEPFDLCDFLVRPGKQIIPLTLKRFVECAICKKKIDRANNTVIVTPLNGTWCSECYN